VIISLRVGVQDDHSVTILTVDIPIGPVGISSSQIQPVMLEARLFFSLPIYVMFPPHSSFHPLYPSLVHYYLWSGSLFISHSFTLSWVLTLLFSPISLFYSPKFFLDKRILLTDGRWEIPRPPSFQLAVSSTNGLFLCVQPKSDFTAI